MMGLTPSGGARPTSQTWDPEFSAFHLNCSLLAPGLPGPQPSFLDLNFQPAWRPPTQLSRPGPQQASAERACQSEVGPGREPAGPKAHLAPIRSQNYRPMSQSRCFSFFSCSKWRDSGSVHSCEASMVGSGRS